MTARTPPLPSDEGGTSIDDSLSDFEQYVNRRSALPPFATGLLELSPPDSPRSQGVDLGSTSMRSLSPEPSPLMPQNRLTSQEPPPNTSNIISEGSTLTRTPMFCLPTKLKILLIVFAVSLLALTCFKASLNNQGVMATFQVGTTLAGISNIIIGMVIGMRQAWCQMVGAGCLPEPNLPNMEQTPNDSGEQPMMGKSHWRHNNALVEGRIIVDGLQNLMRLGENTSASTDMRLLGFEMADMVSFDDALPWSKDLGRMAPSYITMREQKTAAFSRTFNLLRNVADRYNNAIRRIQLKHSTSSWYNRPSQRHQHEALSTDITYTIRQFHEELVPARLSLSIAEKEANTILGISRKMLPQVKYRLRKLQEYRKRHPVVDKLCWGVGDFELGFVACDAFERDTMSSLLEVLVGTLEYYISDAEEVARVSRSMRYELHSFGAALNDTAGVLPYHDSFHLRGHFSDLLLLGDGVSALSSNLNEVIRLSA